MSKSVLTIHKEIEKKAYAESPLGKLEKEIGRIYDAFKIKNKKLPEDVAEKIYDIRDENEKWQLEYIERTNREHKEAIDAKLLDSMTRELNILKEYEHLLG